MVLYWQWLSAMAMEGIGKGAAVRQWGLKYISALITKTWTSCETSGFDNNTSLNNWNKSGVARYDFKRSSLHC